MQRFLRELLLQVAVFAAYLAACEAMPLIHGADLSDEVASLTAGVTLAACLLGGPRMAAATFLAGTVCMGTEQPLWIAAALAASQSGLCALAARVLRQRHFDVRLERPTDLATLMAVAIPLVAMLDSLVATALVGRTPPAVAQPSWAALGGAGSIWLARTAANAIGATLIVPPALLAMSLIPIPQDARRHWRRGLEFAAFVGGLVLAVVVVPLLTDDGGLVWPIALCLGMPFVILLVVRFARWGALAVAIVVGGTLVLGVAIDRTPAAISSEATQELATVGLWVMTLAILAMAMLLGVTIAAHRSESAEVAAVAARLRHVVEAARLGYWQFGPSWRTELVNARLAGMLGTTEESMAGGHILDLVSDRAREDAARQLAAIERGESDSIELECRRRDGRVAWLGLQVTPYRRGLGRDDGGHTRRRFGAIAAVEDLAERRRAEAERLKLETNMLHGQKLESLGVLAGGLAHDFNNIVMGIRGNAGLLRVRATGAGDTQGCADRIESLCQRAAELVATLLAYAGKGDFTMARLSLPQVVREAIGITRLAAPVHARIEFGESDQLLDVTADPHHLRQLLVGILANSLEALPQSGGRIRVRCRSATRTAASNGRSGDVAEVEITDEGTGMGDATLARVFEPFFSTKGLGRGLGMSAALGIARRLGGSIDVESRPGVGTTVRVRIPLADDRSDSPEGRLRGTTQRRPTAILAEPDTGLRDLMKAALEIRGFAVTLERDLAAALATAEDRPPGIVVAHSGPSVLGSLDQVRAARARACDVPLVLTTDHRDSVVIDATDSHTLWLQRPFDVRRLLDALDEATGVRAVPTAR